jgi:hypothetical protein
MVNDQTNSIIGGMFGLEWEPGFGMRDMKPPFLTGREIFLVNARSGIWLLVNQLRPLQVWVPSYLCHTIAGAIDPNATVLRYYEVDYDLKVRSNQWISEVGSGDLVIFIDYFGFPYDHLLGYQIKKKGAYVLEDAAQALLSAHVGMVSDFVLFSPRKWIGVPDGGILRFPVGTPANGISLEGPDATWWLKSLHASILRREFDDGLPTREWFKLFREEERDAPIGCYAMSELAQVLIAYSVDYSIVAARRIENYETLLDKLGDYALFPYLEQDVVPFGFPVRVRNRDTIRQSLFTNQIYPPVHWSIDEIVPVNYEDSYRLASEIMTLPCDQRYAPKDMVKMANVFLESL